MAITRTDFMSTQTGGTGETIQAQPSEVATPEQFAANIKVPQQTFEEPIQPQASYPVQAPIQEAAPIAQSVVPQETSVQQTPEEIMQQELDLNPVDISSGLDPVTENDIPVAEIEHTELPDGISIDRPVKIPEKKEEPMFDISEEDQPEAKVSELPDGLSVEQPDVPDEKEISSLNKEYSLSGIHISKGGKIKKVKADYEKPKPDGIYTYPGTNHQLKKEDGKWYRDSNGDGKFQPVTEGQKQISLIEKNATPKKAPGKPDGDYTIPSNPGTIYRKQGDKWSVDFQGDGNFIEITKGDVAKRIAHIEKNAQPLKSESLGKVENAIQSRLGTVEDFNMKTPLVSGGDPVVADDVTFDRAVKDMKAPGAKDEPLNPDGTINFGYDPKIAKQKELGLYGKPDGEYVFPDSKNTYKKSNGNWYVKPYGGNDFQPITKGNVQERIDQLEQHAYKPLKLKDAVSLVKKADLTYSGIVNKANDLANQFTGDIDDYKKSFDDALNFANNNLNEIYKDNLSEEQKKGLMDYQEQVKKIIGDGTYDTSKGVHVSKVLKDAKAFFESSKEVNKKINEAFQNNVSLDRMSFEDKRRTYKQNLGTTGIETDWQRLSRETFEATSDMAQFILDNVDDGKIRYDRKNGGYTLSPNLDPKERNFIETKLNQYLADYENVQSQKYSETNEKILQLKKDKYLVKENIDKLENRLAYLRKNDMPGQDQVYEELRKQRYLYQKAENQIDDLELSKNTVFLTEPKKAAFRIGSNLSDDAKDIFDSIPNDISPKTKFDMFYKRLEEENAKIAKDNGIDAEGMSTLSMRLKDLLDWEGYYALSDAEKRYLKNMATLKQMAPLYYNNDTGITSESAGFWESFMDGFRSVLLPNTSAADSHALQTTAAATMLEKAQEEGFSPDDFVDKNVLDRLEKRSAVDLMSLEKMGGMLGTTAGIILPLLATRKVPATALRSIEKAEKLITGVKDASKVADLVTKAEKVYDATLSSTKLGRFLKPSIEEGFRFELAGRVVGSTQGELSLLNGLAGGAASEGFGLLLSKLPVSEAASYVNSFFGTNTQQALKVIAKIGKHGRKAMTRGAGETAEELAQELVSVYQSTSNWQDMKKELENRFGTFDKVQEFVLSTFVMGAAFGLADTKQAKETLDALPEDKKNQVLQAMGAVSADMKKADEAVEEFSDNKLKQQQLEQKSKEKEYRTGAPSATGGANNQKVKTNDTENKQGVSSEERIGQEPVQAEPIAKPSEEAPSPSGVVQEKQGKAEVSPEMFQDFSAIKKMKNAQEKKAAIDDFNTKHNGMYKRAEMIDKHFNGIFRSLNKMNLVKKKC